MFKKILPLNLIISLRMFGLFIVLPVLSVYALDMPHSSHTMVGIIIGGYAITQMLFQVPFGTVSDKIGRKKTIIVGLIIFAIGSLIGALAILGNSEKFAFIIFIPYFIEGLLFLRAMKDLGHPVEAFGIPDEKDCLKEPKEKCYHQTHCIIKLLRKLKGCAKERDVTLVAIIYELVFVILGLALFDILKLF